MKGGVADSEGRLMQGDQILSVNGEDMRDVSQEHAAAVLKVRTLCHQGTTLGDSDCVASYYWNLSAIGLKEYLNTFQ